MRESLGNCQNYWQPRFFPQTIFPQISGTNWHKSLLELAASRYKKPKNFRNGNTETHKQTHREIEKEGSKMEKTYVVIGADGRTEYIYAPTAQAAILEVSEYLIRPYAVRAATYGEWECGGTCEAHKKIFSVKFN